jgi:hypothetical protein
MTESLVETLRSRIEGLEWVGQYGGLVRTISRIIPSVEGKSIQQVFPVSCNVNINQCWETGEYQSLAPNDAYKSVCYFEQLGSLQTADSPLPNVSRYTVPLRFVAWLNLKKLGIENGCNTSERIETNVMQLFDFHFQGVAAGSISGLLSCEIRDIISKDDGVFRKYSYSDKQNLLFSPYDFFSIDIELMFDTDGKCVQPFVLQPEILC